MGTVAGAPTTRVFVDAAERERRRFAVDTANGNQRGEGIHVTPFLRQLTAFHEASRIAHLTGNTEGLIDSSCIVPCAID